MLKKDINNGFLKVSQLVESEHEGISQLVEFDVLEFEKRAYKDSTHRLQFLTSRMLLKEIIENDLGLSYKGLSNKNGVPDEIEGYTVSVSHSEDFVAVGVSKSMIGVDIQKKENKVSRVIGRICTETELNLCDDSLSKTILWSVKESFYKRQRVSGIDFRKQLFVDSFKINESEIIGVGRVFVNSVSEIVRFEGKIIKDYVFIYTV